MVQSIHCPIPKQVQELDLFGYMTKMASLVIDSLSIFSILGIWPRYIEPKILKKTYLSLPLSRRNSSLKGLKIIQLTDLHFHKNFSLSFLKKILKVVRSEQPDLIFFTGDFLCYSQMENREIFHDFLNAFQAPLGSFCVLGNHDYATYVSRNREGNYAPKAPMKPLEGIFQGLSILFFEKRGERGQITEEAKQVRYHEELLSLLQETPFCLLNNETRVLSCGLNIVGLGEYTLGRAHPELAFKNYNRDFPGIILVHNPDTIPLLNGYPGDLVMSGHTHGEQIHIPFLKKLSKKLARLENFDLTRGLYHIRDKVLYVNRGLGGHEPFRLCSPPEILVLTII